MMKIPTMSAFCEEVREKRGDFFLAVLLRGLRVVVLRVVALRAAGLRVVVLRFVLLEVVFLRVIAQMFLRRVL
jgi:hypothetical protein